MEIWDFQGQNSDKELVFHLGTHINVRIFNRVHVSKHWLYQITWSIFGNLVLPQVSERELIPFERWIHRHSSGKAFGPRDWSNTFYNTKVWFLFSSLRRNLLPPPLGAHPRVLSPDSALPKIPAEEGALRGGRVPGAGTVGLDGSSLTLSELLHQPLRALTQLWRL